MTRKERILAAIRHQPVDRLPFCTYNFHPYANAAHLQDPAYRELLALVEEKAGMYCKSWVPPVRSAKEVEKAWTTRKVEERADRRTVTTALHTPRGELRSVQVTPKGQPAMVTEHFLKDEEYIPRYLSLPWEPPDYDLGPVLGLERQLGDRGIITLAYQDPMYSAAQLFDFQEFCIRCLTRPESLRVLMDHLFEQIAEETRRQAALCRGHDLLFLTNGPEVATPPMLSPATFRALVVPYQKRLVEIIHDAGLMAMIHCHGRVRQVLEYFIEIGADAIEPIEPPPQGDITLAELLPAAGGRLALMGHIQDQEFHTAPPGLMTRRVEDIARVARGRTGYIMSPSCTPFQFPPSPTFVRNYREWIEAAARLL